MSQSKSISSGLHKTEWHASIDITLHFLILYFLVQLDANCMLSWWYLLCFSISCWFRTKLSQAKVLSCAVPDCRSSDGSPSKATWWPGGAWLRVLPLRRVVVDWMGSKTVAWLTSRETLIEQRRRPPRVLFGMKLSWACGHETRGRGSVRKRSRNKLIIRPRPTNPMSSLINDFFRRSPAEAEST